VSVFCTFLVSLASFFFFSMGFAFFCDFKSLFLPLLTVRPSFFGAVCFCFVLIEGVSLGVQRSGGFF